MAINGILATEPTSKSSENIINSYMTFNDEFTYDFTSGIGNVEVSNSTEYPLFGIRSMKIRALSTLGSNFNAADKSSTIIRTTGLHQIQWQAFKTDPNATVNLTVEVYVNDVLTSSRTINVEMHNSVGFDDNSWNIYYQSFAANQGDVVTLGWYFQSDIEDCVVYLDGFKIERNDQQLIAPSFYTDPSFLATKWSRIYDFIDTQLLFEDTAINFGLFEGTFESNCGSEILVEGVGFKPTRLNSLFTVNANFTAKVPAGTNIYIDAVLKINGIDYMGQNQYLLKPQDEFQYINIVFHIPANAEFLQYEGAIELTARGNNIQIYRRLLVVTEQVNYN